MGAQTHRDLKNAGSMPLCTRCVLCFLSQEATFRSAVATLWRAHQAMRPRQSEATAGSGYFADQAFAHRSSTIVTPATGISAAPSMNSVAGGKFKVTGSGL